MRLTRRSNLALLAALLLGACSDSAASSVTETPDGSAPRDPVPVTGDAGPGVDASTPPPLDIVREGPDRIGEDRALLWKVRVTGGRGGARLFAAGLPPGAHWDEARGELDFVPDFLQGGRTWSVEMTAVEGAARVTERFDLTVTDDIAPPAPVITRTETFEGYLRLTVTQTTDGYLDSPGYAGRSFTAVVIAPTQTAARLPVRVGLHGFGGAPQTDGWSGEFRIFPSDPNDTYWWGYGSSLPGPTVPTTGDVPAYTQRRVMNLLGWVLSRYPTADAERVYLDGVSMGGAGGMTLGLLHARHFCHVRAGYGQAIPKNHRPSRIAQLRTLWGAPETGLSDGAGMPVWDRMDLTRVLRDVPEARDQFLSLHHAKDDPTIHFGAVVMPSALTGKTFYGALQSAHVGHHAVWDEGAHVLPDPVLGNDWWTAGWDPVFDTTSLLLRNRAFPAFSGTSVDRNPGTGKGNGKRAFNAESGFAGTLATPEDTGWDGDIAGGINRFLRWDGTKIVDTWERFEIPLRVLDAAGGAPPRAGYPTTGDKLEGVLPVTTRVTPRRTQAFRCRPGETVDYRVGSKSGSAVADETGAVTIPDVELGTSWTTLEITRRK